MFGFRRSRVFGLDIGSSSVKTVELRKNDGSYAVTAAGIVDIPLSGDNEIDREPDTVGAIRECIQRSGIQAKLAVCGVCGPEIAVRDFRFPSLPAGELEGAIMLEAEQICPFSTEDSAIDYQMMSNGDGGSRGVLVGATNTAIRNKAQLVADASVKCVLMDVDGLALLNCFNVCEESQPEGATPILNVGSSYTTLAIGDSDDPPFVRDMAFAGNEIVGKIAAEHGMSTQTVKEILSGSSDEDRSTLTNSLEKACERLIVDVNETMRYYAAQAKSGLARSMLVCGGFALLKEFMDLLNLRLSVRALLWNPFDKMQSDVDGEQQDILRNKGPEMAVAAGLAMRSI